MRPWEWSAKAKVAAVQLLCDGVLTALIVARVPYTEIDFEAYMQQVSQIAQGERNYGSISGSTGPLVYPAGFAWLFLAIQHATGGSVALAQRLFACLYLASTALALAFSASAHSVPTAALPLLSSSKRFHSIFTLRLFNDAVVCFLTNASLAVASFYSLVASSIVLSLAVSVKMNALLLLPPLAVLMLKRCSLASIALSALSFVAMQLALALPFLLHSPISYFSSAFDLSRDFLYEWSVNWQFVPEPIFHNTFFSRSLLALHLVSLFLLAHFKWCSDQPHGLLGAAYFTHSCAPREGSSRRHAHPDCIMLFTYRLDTAASTIAKATLP
jgi:alpha-1,3-mannosyltransferase